MRIRRIPLAGRCTLAVLLTLVALCCGSAAMTLWQVRTHAREDAAREAYDLGRTIADETGRALEPPAAVLDGIRRTIVAADGLAPEKFRRITATAAFADTLRRHLDDLPQAIALRVIDPDGARITAAGPGSEPATADRDILSLCRDDPATTADGPIISSTPFALVRCMTDAGGHLLGVLAVTLQADYFRGIARSMPVPPGSDIALIAPDGRTLLAENPAAAWVTHVTPPTTTYTAPLAEVFQTGTQPAVRVGIVRATTSLRWFREIFWIALGRIAALGFGILVLARLLFVIRHLRDAKQSLLDHNAALTDTRADLDAQATLLETTLAHMDQGLMMVDARGHVAVCNRRAIEMLDLPPALMAGRPSFTAVLAHQWQSEEFACTSPEVKEIVRKGSLFDSPESYERERPNGRTIEVFTIPLAGGGIVRTYTDVTKRKEAERRLTHTAEHDALTGLANRRALETRLKAAVEGSRQDESGLAVMYLDLDRFKLVNDTHGHAVGDALLMQVAQRMHDCLRHGDLVARLGGDEFAVVLHTGASRDVARGFAERLKTDVSAPYDIGGVTCRIGVSVGVALHPTDGDSIAALLRSADSALYRAKAAGRNAICFHEIEAEHADRDRLLLEQELRLAVAGHQFELLYQPIFSTATGLPHCFEALLRWRHPTRGLLSPDVFIGLAEQTGLIKDIGNWVLRTASAEAATWATPARLAVNLSTVQFDRPTPERPGLEQQVLAALAASGLPPDRLELEVTESLLIRDSDEVRSTMAALQRHGVRLVMDDFGTGYASLQALQSFPFQQLKIDRSFVARMDDAGRNGAIVQAMLTMAESMHLDVVAEGVETLTQQNLLRDLGCAYLQGYLLSRPLTPGRVRELLWPVGGERVLARA